MIYLKKNSVTEVYDLIISDLIFAENNQPEVQALVGKPTKYAAKIMLADVCLTLDKYTAAGIEVLNKVHRCAYGKDQNPGY